MPLYLEYRSQRYSTLRIEVDPTVEFRLVVEDFATLRFPPIGVNHDLVGFALLELISNSIRAHLEHGVTEPVSVSFAAGAEGLSVTVLDAGRGFNPSLLPYDLAAPVDSIDLMGEAFMAYREKNSNRRFGMGIYSVKKIFPRFSLDFVDREGRSCPWFAGAVRGTRIDLGISYVDAASGLASNEAASPPQAELIEEI
jgi:anti-sigma regulatory factor (Ser/Thr protein kinase)